MPDGVIPRQLAAILDLLGYEYDSLFGPHEREARGERRNKVVGWLYRALDTLDSKTSHLLRFASLLLAAQTFLATLLVRGREPSWFSVIVLLLLLFPLMAAVWAIWIFAVKWLFFGKVRRPGDTRPDDSRIKEELRALAELCDDRARMQRWTFYLCLVAAGAFFITLVLALYAVSPRLRQ